MARPWAAYISGRIAEQTIVNCATGNGGRWMSRFVMLVGALLAGFVLLPAFGEMASDTEELDGKATEFVGLLSTGDFSKAARGFDGAMSHDYIYSL